MRARLLAVVIAVALLPIGITAVAPRARAADRTLVLEMVDVTFSPNVLSVDPGHVVTIRVFNNETLNIAHTFELDAFDVHLGTAGNPINRGENRSSASFTAVAGTFYFYCGFPGHAVNGGTRAGTGMVGTLQVGDAPPPTDATPIIVGGLVVLVVSVVAIAYATRRASKKPKSP